MKDFTIHAYRSLLSAIQKAGYAFFTFEEWCKGNATGRYVILRHDVDLKAANSLITARIESEMGIHATYYFRIVPQSNQPGIIKSIADLGHEIGYHYEDLSLFRGDKVKAIEHFRLQLDYFRQFYPVKTICMHGSPTSKWDNRDLWNDYDYRNYGILGEPYFDLIKNNDILNQKFNYFTDTARMWDGDMYNLRDRFSGDNIILSNDSSARQASENIIPLKNDIATKSLKIHSTFDMIGWLNTMPVDNIMMMTTHPQRWTNNRVDWFVELLMQNIKNRIKKIMVRRRGK